MSKTMKLAAEFNRYLTSSNGIDVPERVSVSRDEWRALFTAIQQAEAQQPATGEPVAWLFKCYRPGTRIEYASIDKNDTAHWPIDQWKTVECRPLVFSDTHPAPSVPKDDQIAALVNKVRDIARMFHDHQSLRERIAIELVPALKASQEVKSNAERWRYAIADGGNQSMNFIDIFGDWDGDGDFVEVFDAARLADKKGGAQ